MPCCCSIAVGCFVVINCMLLSPANGVTIPNATFSEWDGWLGYFAVPKARVESRLQELQAARPDNEEYLSVPTKPILPGLISSDQHVIAVVYGNRLEASSFKEALTESNQEYSVEAQTLQLYIPFLSGTNSSNKPIYKLPLASFVATVKPFIEPNPALHTQQVESMIATDEGLVIQDGEDVFEISWTFPNSQTCGPPANYVVHDFEAYIDEFTVSYKTEMDFSICDEIDVEVDLCQIRDSISSELSRNRLNSCEYWSHGHNVKRCSLNEFRIDQLSPRFKDISLLSGDEGPAIITESISGTFGIGIKVPCIDT